MVDLHLIIVLWLAWAALLFGGFALGREWDDKTRRMPVWTRMGSSLALVFAAWSFYITSRGEIPVSSLAFLIAFGMTCGFVGDLFMARLLLKSDRRIIGAMGAFALGHVAYILGILLYADEVGLTPLWVIVGIAWLIGLVWWFIVVYQGGERDVTHYAALPYTLLLSTTAGLAIAFAAVDDRGNVSGFTIMAIGGILFLISDLILAAQLFRNAHFRLIDDVVWLTYGPAQMMIVYSLLWFLPLRPFIYGGV